MRGLSTRNVRPCLQHNNFSFSTPSIRRTTFSPLQKAFTCADAFLLFLPSVLTAALVVDYTGKQRQRAEWDQQIALAQEEADRLKQRQLESWSRIQRRSVSHGAWQQRRSLFTASQSAQFIDEEREEMMDPLDRKDEIDALDAQITPGDEIRIDQTTDDLIKKKQRFGRLIATRLALELMLKLRQGRSPLYKPQPTVDTTDKTYYQSMDYIVHELNKVLELVRDMQIQKVPWDVQMPAEYLSQRDQMGQRLLRLSKSYAKSDIHLPDYIMSYVQLVTDYRIGPPNYAYVVMMRTLAFKQYDTSMAGLVENAIYDNHQYLDNYAISNLVYHYGTTVNSHRFSEFLERLSRPDQHPRPVNSWHLLNVDDTDITVPRTKSGHVITSLIRTALMCRQHTIAEAYATLFIDRDRVEKYSGVHKWFVIGSFLQSYGASSSWKAGQRWLRVVLDWAADLDISDGYILGRVILRMLDFCVACGKKEDYETIMSAVDAAQLLLPAVDMSVKPNISERMASIRLDWSNRLKYSSYSSNFDPVNERVQKFRSMLSGRWMSESQDKDESGIKSSAWTEEGIIPYNPFVRMAAERLEEAKRQRQLEVDTGFKGFTHYTSRRQSFWPDVEIPSSKPEGEILEQESQTPEPEGKTIHEEDDTHSQIRSDLSSTEFSSPFFVEATLEPRRFNDHLLPHETSIEDEEVIRPADFSSSVAGFDSYPKLTKLEKDLKEARRRLRDTEKQKEIELNKLKRELENAQARLREANVKYTPYNDNEEDPVKSSATGTG